MTPTFVDPWWLMLIKVVVLLVVLLTWTIFNVWYERRLLGKMQHRLGPIMNGPFGLGQALADGVKLLLKEDFRPNHTDKWVFNLAPLLTGMAAFTAWTVIPFGGEVTMFGHVTRIQVTDLPVAVLFVLAIASIGIYGVVLAGWASNNTYSFLGGIRSSAQMISYEIAMGLAIIGVFMLSGSMSTSQIVEAQRAHITFSLPWSDGVVDLGIMGWYFLLLFPSFVIYGIAMVGETNRAPFDLPECESELVGGFMTEYSGFRYAMFFLAEYINMATVSAVMVTLFLGGYLPFWPLNTIEALNNPWLGPIWFVIKVQLIFSVFMWLRGSLPRFRYDQFMDLGWKTLIPLSLIWIMVVAVFPKYTMPAALLMLIAFMVRGMFRDSKEEKERQAKEEAHERMLAEPFDAFAEGYPVPPRPGQKLPDFADVVTGTTEQPVAAEGSDK